MSYSESIRRLSDRLVEIQKPILILNAIKWGNEVEERFFATGGRELPQVDRDYYEQRPLAYDARDKTRQLLELERDVERTLGHLNPVGEILERMCREYAAVVAMIAARGSEEFSLRSQRLYGSAHDVFHAGEATLADLGVSMSASLKQIFASGEIVEDEREITGSEAVRLLQERLDRAFSGVEESPVVRLDDGIVSDAAAGADYVKIRHDARFSPRDLRLLEIHEGWVHLGTTLNGRRQQVCTFLSKGPPSSTITQEGLAILMEILCLASHPARVQRLTGRIVGVRMAEDGADFLEVYRYFLEHGLSERQSYANTVRVFRGSIPSGGPFTKDLSYTKGFVQIYNFVQLAVRKGQLRRIPLLFCGKTTLEDVAVLEQLVDEGLVAMPEFLPEPIRDLQALSAWMCYSVFLNQLDLVRVESDYSGLL